MPTTNELEVLLVENLGRIERIARSLCRRYGVSDDDAEDFRSWVQLRLIEDDYAILRKFRGESAITTYLTVVVAMLMRDYRAAHWGRWRPSAAALRQGEVAVRLETLVYRDGMQLRQAAEALRTTGLTERSDRELGELLGQLPAREPLRPLHVGPAPLEGEPGSARADDAVRREETEAERSEVQQALDEALSRLPAEDRLILRLRFWDGLSVADIARGLRVPQKPLYRRIERALAGVRSSLGAAGLDAERVLALREEGRA